jgi:pimeloyl-ACP methyl ester carboxylesterase
LRDDRAAIDLPIWQEALFGMEVLLLHAAPVYYGFGVPRGDDSAVVIIPGFLLTDLYLVEMYGWLSRIGYQPYFSGIGLNADCPNLLIRRKLSETIQRARRKTGRRIHVIGHSLGGVLARSIAGDLPDEIASVITLGSPFRGNVAHPRLLQAVEVVRRQIKQNHGTKVLPDCYSGACTCAFLDSLGRELAPTVAETAIYTRNDGLVDWRYCITGNPDVDVEVSGTHVGLGFNPAVYNIIAKRLAAVRTPQLA